MGSALMNEVGTTSSITRSAVSAPATSIVRAILLGERIDTRGLDDPRLVYDKLRELVAKGQATRRTMIVEDDVEHEQFSGN